MKKVLWFSRHTMTAQQIEALGANIEVTQVNGDMPNVHIPFEAKVNGEDNAVVFKDFAKGFDILAIVAPVGLQQQVLSIAGDKPVIMAKNKRTLVPNPEGGEDKVVFVFDLWEQLVKIDIVLKPFVVS
jgi:hypothetical protein